MAKKGKKKNTFYSVVIIPEHERVSTNLKVHVKWLWVLFTFAVLGVGFLTFFIYDNYHMYTKALEYDVLVKENQRLSNENQRLDQFADELQKLRSFRERTERTLASTNQFKSISASSASADSILQILRETPADEQKYIESLNAMFEAIPSISPISNPILSRPFEQKLEDKSGHLGVDIVASKGTPVLASGNGVVLFSGWTNKYGYTIILKHINNYISIYKHNLQSNVQEGQFVKRGNVIGYVGNTGKLSTGTHCHFEIWKNGVPIDPALLIKNLQ